MARRDLTLNYTDGDGDRPHSVATPHTPKGRTVDLHVHLSAAALSGGEVVGRLANTRTPISVEQIRQWCRTAGIVLVRPVIDVAGHEPTGAYEIAERQARQVLLRDQTCTFPGCTAPAEACDLDHVQAHSQGGITCPCNLAPACRPHHRLKTHRDGWTYRALAPGVYHWRARTGDQWLITPGGTYRLDTRPCPGSSDATDPPPE